MSNCLNCGKEVPQKEGKRQRKYCDDSCKMAFHNKKKPKESKYVLKSTYEALKKDYETLIARNVAENNKPENKAHILAEINEVIQRPAEVFKQPLTPKEAIKQPIQSKMPEGLGWKEQLEWKRNQGK